jgi:hypothetical protein
MPTKNSQNLNITTSSSIGVDAKGKTFSRSSITTSQTITKRRMSSGETAGGLLTTIGQLQMIGISLLVISIGTAVVQFDESDLISTTPNYNLVNQYVPIADPLNNVDYQQYGEGVFDSLIGFVEFLQPFGDFAQAGWTLFFQIADTDNLEFVGQPNTSFGQTFGANRVLTLSQMRFSSLKAYYDELSPDEREWVLDNVNSTKYGALETAFYETRWYLFVIIEGNFYFFYTEQSVYDYVVELGLGT